MSSKEELAVLDPQPVVDYSHYRPRHQKLNLSGYRSRHEVVRRRLDRIESFFEPETSVLEIGAADGAFLRALGEWHPSVRLHAIEPDRETQEAREAVEALMGFDSFDALKIAGMKIDMVCAFHVFEHILEPDAWLESIRELLVESGGRGRLILEVPALTDPLRRLFRSEAFEGFYFQRQHPFVHSGASLKRILEDHGFSVTSIPYQRYGLSNHLAWLTKGEPGGDPAFERIFGNLDPEYRKVLEEAGTTDTAIAVGDLRD